MSSLLTIFRRHRASELTEEQIAMQKLATLYASIDFAVICGADHIAPLLRELGGKNEITDAEIDMAGLRRAIEVAKEGLPNLQAKGISPGEEELIRLVTQRWRNRGDLMP